MNKAALRDLETIEKFHRDRMVECRQRNLWQWAEVQQKMAETVRVCIVTIQAAEVREPD